MLEEPYSDAGLSMLVELLSKVAMVAMLSFVVSSMLAQGAGLTIAQIFEPLRDDSA